MSFSSRVICETPPPVSPEVRVMGTLLWLLPLLMSGFILIASPWTGAKQKPLEPEPSSPAASSDVPSIDEPWSFARTRQSLALQGASGLARPDFLPLAHVWRSAISRGDEQTTRGAGMVSPAKSERRAPWEQTTAVPLREGRQNFRIARASGPTTLEADGVMIALQDIEPLPQGAVCRRIDGATLPCHERAIHRLSVLLSGREISCQLSANTLPTGERLGRCVAGQIELSADLLRQKLVQRRSTRLAQSANRPS